MSGLARDLIYQLDYHRQQNGITYKDLALRLNMNPAYLYRFFQNKNDAGLRLIINIAHALNLHIDVRFTKR